jgi:zona occludens toxin (predicted ATPase)
MKAGLRQRLARIETEARTLARSGNFGGFASIERALLTRGFDEAPRIFANRWTQSEVDRLCHLARRVAVSSARTTAG